MHLKLTDGKSQAIFHFDAANEQALIKASKRPVSKALEIVRKRYGDLGMYPIQGQALVGINV